MTITTQPSTIMPMSPNVSPQQHVLKFQLKSKPTKTLPNQCGYISETTTEIVNQLDNQCNLNIAILDKHNQQIQDTQCLHTFSDIETKQQHFRLVHCSNANCQHELTVACN